jgi:hypothetical protein
VDSRLVLLETGSAVPLCLLELDPGHAEHSPTASSAFPVFLVDDAQGVRTFLDAGGVGCTPLLDDEAGVRFSVADPDGNRIELLELRRAVCAPPQRSQVASDMTVAFTADQPGTLARALEAVTLAGIDTGGYAEIEGYFHLLVSNPEVARRAFEQAGFRVEGAQPVLVVDLQDRPGATAGLFREVANAGVNVSFTYATADGRLVIGSQDIQQLTDAVSLMNEE